MPARASAPDVAVPPDPEVERYSREIAASFDQLAPLMFSLIRNARFNPDEQQHLDEARALLQVHDTRALYDLARTYLLDWSHTGDPLRTEVLHQIMPLLKKINSDTTILATKCKTSLRKFKYTDPTEAEYERARHFGAFSANPELVPQHRFKSVKSVEQVRGIIAGEHKKQ